jgi:hypothetical protein
MTPRTSSGWKDWVEKHQAAIVTMGGPLGKTKKITQRGIEETSNDMGAFTVVRAESKEAAAKLFENHPHFTIFPGESVEVMPVLPIPGAVCYRQERLEGRLTCVSLP